MTSNATLKLRVSELPLVRPSPRLADPVQTGGGGAGGGGHGHGCCARAGRAAAKVRIELSNRVVIRNARSFENESITVPRSRGADCQRDDKGRLYYRGVLLPKLPDSRRGGAMSG